MFGKVPHLMDHFEKVFSIANQQTELNEFLAAHPESYIVKPRALYRGWDDKETHVNFQAMDDEKLVIVKYKVKRTENSS